MTFIGLVPKSEPESDLDTLSPRQPKQRLRAVAYVMLVLLDIAVIWGVPTLLEFFVEPIRVRNGGMVFLAIVPVYLVVSQHSGAFSYLALHNRRKSMRLATMSFTIALISVLVAVFFMKQAEELSRLVTGIGAVSTFVALALARFTFVGVLRQITRGHLLNQLVLIDNVDVSIRKKAARLINAEKAGIVPDLSDPAMLHRFGTLVRMYDRILICCPPELQSTWAQFLKGAHVEGELVVQSPNELDAITLSNFDRFQTLVVSRRPLGILNRAQKRVLDLCISIPAIILLMPLFVFVGLAIWLEDRGPIFFRQSRVGRGNCQFSVVKFRSMRVESSDSNGSRSASRKDDRVTRIGRFIRATSIDELPQLFNVVRNDMSLVGPRPHALGSTVDEMLFWEVDRSYWLRHQLKPGITGLAQVRGYRGATNKRSDLTSRLKADMEYIEGWTLARDVFILLGTLRVFVHRNAY